MISLLVSASSLNCCFYQFVVLSYVLYFLTFCIFNLYRTFLKTTLRDGSFLTKDFYFDFLTMGEESHYNTLFCGFSIIFTVQLLNNL